MAGIHSLDQHLTMGLEHADEVAAGSRATDERSRLLSEQIRLLQTLLRKLESRVNQIEDRT